MENDKTGWFRVSANVSSLAHRALASLPLANILCEKDELKLDVKWRLVRHEPRVFSDEALRVVLESIGHAGKIRTRSLASTSEYFEHQVSSTSRTASILTLDDSPGEHEISVCGVRARSARISIIYQSYYSNHKNIFRVAYS